MIFAPSPKAVGGPAKFHGFHRPLRRKPPDTKRKSPAEKWV
ncbi:hypothetical protein CLOLEP_00901 [[Clostridium] leptum DSM 753]|uniref:Uncharacterized protein n=1 Tax=[Clostridium] leptum DSM 753 TaxID=428125 RepID=A7VQS0_9FIRM|nr:hypothetical protein CLOLEP_00901 [[Clostridium] leptum DSM 753]